MNTEAMERQNNSMEAFVYYIFKINNIEFFSVLDQRDFQETVIGYDSSGITYSRTLPEPIKGYMLIHIIKKHLNHTNTNTMVIRVGEQIWKLDHSNEILDITPVEPMVGLK
jgi:exo-beta-1,3-glucanase (GH17 family)